MAEHSQVTKCSLHNLPIDNDAYITFTANIIAKQESIPTKADWREKKRNY